MVKFFLSLCVNAKLRTRFSFVNFTKERQEGRVTIARVTDSRDYCSRWAHDTFMADDGLELLHMRGGRQQIKSRLPYTRGREWSDRKSSLATRKPIIKAQRLSLIHISEPTRLLSISYAVFCLK